MKPQLDSKITDLFKRHKFTLSAEIIPPRNGAGSEAIFNQIEGLKAAGAQYLAVTKGAGGSLRGGSLPIAQIIKETFQTPCIAHFTCRDLLPEEVENQLIDHHFFGIRNILALRGDPPEGVTNWEPRAGSHKYAYQLIEQILKLNHAIYLKREGFDQGNREKTDFCVGAACYPDQPNKAERIEFFDKKIKAGATYAISQMLFDPESYARFLDETAYLNVPILPGTRLLSSQQQAHRMSLRFDVPISKKYLASLPETDKETSPERTLSAFLTLTEQLRKLGSPGIHIFVLNNTELAQTALRQLSNQT